jgi:hypothetical protein
MGKGHRDNHRARKKIGDIAFEKKRERRRRRYIGPWNVTFVCTAVVYVPIAGCDDVNNIARHMHKCGIKDCKPNNFERVL